MMHCTRLSLLYRQSRQIANGRTKKDHEPMTTSGSVTEKKGKPSEEAVAASPLFGSCPLPIFDHKQIVLGHGSGGKLTADLIDKVFLPAFKNPVLDKLDDQAVITINGSRLAFTTDS